MKSLSTYAWSKIACSSVFTIVLYAANLQAQTISTGSVSGSPFCINSIANVPFTITGSFNSGNIFTAQLSDASGNFASPVNIGTVTSTVAGSVAATIPAGTPAGTGY